LFEAKEKQAQAESNQKRAEARTNKLLATVRNLIQPAQIVGAHKPSSGFVFLNQAIKKVVQDFES